MQICNTFLDFLMSCKYLECLVLVLCKFQDIEKYKLGDPTSFYYLNQSNCYELDGVDDAEEYLATRRAMDIVGISEEQQVVFQKLTVPYAPFFK